MDGLPLIMANRIETILNQIDKSAAALNSSLERQFVLARRASELKAPIKAGRASVNAAIDDIDSRLLGLDVGSAHYWARKYRLP